MINSRLIRISRRAHTILRCNRSAVCSRPFKTSIIGTEHCVQKPLPPLNYSRSVTFCCNTIQNRALSGVAGDAVVVEELESLGDSITTAVLLSWNKEPGDSVKEDDVIAVVETDKVTMDIRAKRSGVFIEALADTDSEVAVGAPLYKLDTSIAESPVNTEATLGNTAPPVTTDNNLPPITVDVPIMGESVTTGVLGTWMVQAGEYVRADDVVAVIETDKVNVDVRAPEDGKVSERYAEEGDEIEVGNKLFLLDPTPAVSGSLKTASVQSKPKETSKEKAVTPSHDAPPPQAPTPSAPAAPSPAVVTTDRSETRVKMTRMRQRISQRLKEAQNTAAMLTTFQEVDMTNLIAMRNQYKELFEKEHAVKLGFMSAFVRASTATLLEIPAVNAVIDDDTNEIVYRNYVDISVAVASPNGLVVPVLRNTEKMNFADVEKTIGMFGKKAKDGSLALEDMAGGTFTISNGGVFGSLFGTPIINPPQSAILGMHATKMRPVVVPGTNTIEARPMMYLALTYDHRMIDGREAVTFLKSVQAKIEDPSRLLLQL